MRISDWSSDVCSSDLGLGLQRAGDAPAGRGEQRPDADVGHAGVDLAGQRGLLGPGPGAVLLGQARAQLRGDRKSVGMGKSVSVRVYLGRRRTFRKKQLNYVNTAQYITSM